MLLVNYIGVSKLENAPKLLSIPDIGEYFDMKEILCQPDVICSLKFKSFTVVF